MLALVMRERRRDDAPSEGVLIDGSCCMQYQIQLLFLILFVPLRLPRVLVLLDLSVAYT